MFVVTDVCVCVCVCVQLNKKQTEFSLKKMVHLWMYICIIGYIPNRKNFHIKYT